MFTPESFLDRIGQRDADRALYRARQAAKRRRGGSVPTPSSASVWGYSGPWESARSEWRQLNGKE